MNGILKSGLLAWIVLAGVALGACGDSGSAAAPVAGGAPAGPTTVQNCGRTLSFPAVPTRVVSLYPSMTELVIALGRSDRLVGQANLDLSPPLAQFATAFAAVPVISTSLPSKEVLLNARPDLIVADGEYWFDGKQLPTMKALAALGIPVYINTAFCHQEVTKGTITDAQTDLTNLGRILGAQPAASTVARQQRAIAADVQQSLVGTRPVVTAMVSVSDQQLYLLARGLYSGVLEAAGGRNYFEDELPAGQYFGQVSPELLATAPVEAIVYTYTTEETRSRTETYLRQRFPTVPAVRNNRLIAIEESAFSGELHSYAGQRTLARALHPAAT